MKSNLEKKLVLSRQQTMLHAALDSMMNLEGSSLEYIALRANLHPGILSRFLRKKRGLSPLNADQLEDCLIGYFYWEKPKDGKVGEVVLKANIFKDEICTIKVRGISAIGYDEHKP